VKSEVNIEGEEGGFELKVGFFGFIDKVTIGEIRKADNNEVSSVVLEKIPKSRFRKN
jgi:hypothetical protein